MRANRIFKVCVIVSLLCVPLPLAADPPSGNRDGAEEQVAFGIFVAQRALWAEATYRFERATQLDPTYAPAFNNLAIAYEQKGRLDEARQMYERARWIPTTNTSAEITSCSSRSTHAGIAVSDDESLLWSFSHQNRVCAG